MLIIIYIRAKDANNHVGETEIRDYVAEDCGNDGYTGDTYCKDCGVMIKEGSVIPATGAHTWNDGVVTKVPTCAAEGEKFFTCTVCGDTKTEAIAKDASNHIGQTELRGVKEPGCISLGYTGDVCCVGCDEVLVQGETIPATGIHKFEPVGDQLICECGEVYLYTGLITIDGINYYLTRGVLTPGWVDVEGTWYYFDRSTYAGLNGDNYTEENIRYNFDNGRLTANVWTQNSYGYRYWFGPDCYRNTTKYKYGAEPYVIDGKTYLFDMSGIVQLGIVWHPVVDENGDAVIVYFYDCGTTDGVAKLLDGTHEGRLYLGGLPVSGAKLVKLGEDYYFVGEDGMIAMNTSLKLGEEFTAQYGLPEYTYEFDAEGKMILRNGVIDGYLYIGGIMQKAYQLIKFQGNYYFVNDYNKVMMNGYLPLTDRFTAQYGLAAGRYYFDAEGKMVVDHGVIGDYLYIEGVLQKAYQLVEFEGNYYFVNDYNKIAKNISLSLSEKFTKQYGLAAGTYYFDAEGRMIISNGFVNGRLYINGELMRAYQLIKYEGYYYFINDYDKILKSGSLPLSAKFTEQYGLPAGTYYFDAEGRMVLNHGIVGDYLYINGALQKAYQLIRFEGEYYFVNDYDKILRNKSINLSETFTGKYGIPAGTYYFDAEGRMVYKHGVVGDYLYINGELQTRYKLVEFEGNYYFVNDYDKILKKITIYIDEKFTAPHGLPGGVYVFTADGRMILRDGRDGDYFYLGGVLQTAYQIIEFEGDYYFVNDYHKLIIDRTIWLDVEFLNEIDHPLGYQIEAGYYYFDEDGKMVLDKHFVEPDAKNDFDLDYVV
ncbi:MAG: hypothetical protein IJ944_00860 [Clostridia bacterium]|nr:hypothetical protein [Clostridia bacterium]